MGDRPLLQKKLHRKIKKGQKTLEKMVVIQVNVPVEPAVFLN